jgi:hypothetical protein
MTALTGGLAVSASSHAKAGAALLGRGRRPEAAVMSASGFAEMLTNGARSMQPSAALAISPGDDFRPVLQL